MSLHNNSAKIAVALFGLTSVLALAACATTQQPGGTGASSAPPPTSIPAAARPGGIIREGTTFTGMSDQYSRPRPGAVAATGASAWVPPAPPPAFVTTAPLPPADPPAPPLAAVANHQPAAPVPAAPSGADAANLVRPEAAAPDAAQPAAPARDPAVRTAGLQLFNDYSCSACHSLSDAGAAGSIGPSLDRNSRLAKGYLVDVLTNGRGAMPAFGGQMSDAEISTLADYILQYSRK